MKRLSTYPLRSLLASPLGTPPPGAQGHQVPLGGLCEKRTCWNLVGGRRSANCSGQPRKRPAEPRSAGCGGSGGRPRHPGWGGLHWGSGVGGGGLKAWHAPPFTAVTQAAGPGARAHPHPGSQAVCLSVWRMARHENTLTEAVPSSWVLWGGRLALVYQSALAV